MKEEITIASLQKALSGRVPGIQDTRGLFATLVLLCRKGDAWQVLFELRADTLRPQPGETCFPGGRVEEGESPAAAALRETFEEIGIPPEEITLIAPLDVIQDISDRVIHPFLGVVSDQGLARMQPNPSEVKEVFFMPLSYLRQTPPFVYTAPVKVHIGPDFPYERIGFPPDYRWRGGTAEVPIYAYEGKPVWGLSARTLRNMLALLDEVGL